MMDHAERFRILLGLLSAEDYRFVGQRDPHCAKMFRKNRARIFRGELRVIKGEARGLYRERLQNIAAAGRWFSYPPLVWDTALSYFAIAKLSAAGTLFSLDLPRMIDTARNGERVQRFVTSQTLATSPGLHV